VEVWNLCGWLPTPGPRNRDGEAANPLGLLQNHASLRIVHLVLFVPKGVGLVSGPFPVSVFAGKTIH
jgi:hypothetical protein